MKEINTKKTNMMNTKKKKSIWGWGIAFLYGGFVVFILSFVIFSISQDYTLVEDNYYQKSLLYQEKIEMMQNTENLNNKPTLKIDKEENLLTIAFPDSLAQNGIKGQAHFFRPSDNRVDQVLEITINENSEMVVPTSRFIKGLWIMKLSWESSRVSYYQEENLII